MTTRYPFVKTIFSYLKIDDLFKEISRREFADENCLSDDTESDQRKIHNAVAVAMVTENTL